MMLSKTIVILLCFALLAGCAGRKDQFIPPAPDDADYAPPQLNYKSETKSRGSLFSSSKALTIFQDRRAYQVGDILTVLLDEKTVSGKNASTQFGKSSSVNIGAPSIGDNTYDNISANVSGTRDFDGSAESKQGNSLFGSITVTVYNVLPNGVLRVRGEKWIKLNQGDEFIRLTGNVRVEDIQSDNTLSSQRIADARITYAGRGALADSNSAGWFMQFLNSPWMPF